MRDEILLQICKQVTNHPRPVNALKGWELMTIILAAFPPSAELREFLVDFFQRNVNDNTQGGDPEIRKFATMSLERMEIITEIGARLEVPSSKEIKRERTGQLVPIHIFTLANVRYTVDVGTFTQVKEVFVALTEQMGIRFSSIFSIYEFDHNDVSLPLLSTVRILDVVGAWERKAAELKLTDPNFRFMLKAHLMVKSSHDPLSDDPVAMNLMYVQAIYDVQHQVYPYVPKTVPNLAALQLHIENGDYNKATHTVEWVEGKLGEILPPGYISAKKGSKKYAQAAAEAASLIITKYGKLSGVTVDDAKAGYLEYVQGWQLYGAFTTDAEQKQIAELPSELKIAITSEAIHLLDKRTSDVLGSFSFLDIVNYGYAEDRFILVVGDEDNQKTYVVYYRSRTIIKSFSGWIC